MKKHFYQQDIIDICTENHLTVDAIFAEIQKKYPKAGRSTIYRNVEEMCDTKKLTKIIGVGAKAYFEATKKPHAHFICRETGVIHDIPLPVLDLSHLPSSCSIENIDIRIYGKLY